MATIDARPTPCIQPADIAAAVGRHPQQSATEIAAGLARQWCVSADDIPTLCWAVDAAVFTHRQGAAVVINAINGTMARDPSGRLLFPVVGEMLNAAAARPY
jgi:hypothetical protein